MRDATFYQHGCLKVAVRNCIHKTWRDSSTPRHRDTGTRTDYLRNRGRLIRPMADEARKLASFPEPSLNSGEQI